MGARTIAARASRPERNFWTFCGGRKSLRRVYGQTPNGRQILNSGLSGAATAAHIHGPADATATASVACPLTVTESATAGTGTLSGECTTLVVADLNSGMYYVNIHTTAHGGGEIRGQLMKK